MDDQLLKRLYKMERELGEVRDYVYDLMVENDEYLADIKEKETRVLELETRIEMSLRIEAGYEKRIDELEDRIADLQSDVQFGKEA